MLSEDKNDMNKLKSIMINKPSEIIHLSKNFSVVGIDELQFFDNSSSSINKFFIYYKQFFNIKNKDYIFSHGSKNILPDDKILIDLKKVLNAK